MSPRPLRADAFYDGRADIGLRELERIVQGLLWLGDKVLVPWYAQPSPFVPDPERTLVTHRLAELAESGYLKRWRVEGLPPRFTGATWWPSGTSETMLPFDDYSELQRLVTDGVARQKADLARGLGRKPGSMVSGVAELVTLRETLWTLGVARFFGTEILVSSSARSASLVAPLQLLKRADLVRGPVTEQLLELNGVSGLAALSDRDIRTLRRKGSGVRRFVDAVSRDVEGREPFIDSEDAEAVLRDLTAQHFAAVVGESVRHEKRMSLRSGVSGTAVTIAGLVYPPLGLAGFAQPLLEWNPSGRERRRLVVFLTKLQRKTAKRARQ